MMTRTHKLFYLTSTLALALLAAGQPCPSSHPFAYDNGDHCCKNNKEDTIPNKGKGCDGGFIGIGSTCCKGNEFVKCPNPPCENDGMCTSKECKEVSRKILELMNPDADPCNDFHEFACGKFMKDFVMPDDRTWYNAALTPIVEKIFQKGKQLLEADPPKNSLFKTDELVHLLYKSCMNESEIENVGTTPAKELFKFLGGWPAVEGANWDEQGFEWWKVVPKLAKFGLNEELIMLFTVFTDLQNPDYMAMYFDQPIYTAGGLGTKTLRKGFKDENVKHLYTYMVEAAMLMGATNDTAHKEMRDAIQLEIDIATISDVDRDDDDLDLYNKRTVGDLLGQPGYPPNLIDFINEYFSYSGSPEVKVNENSTVIVRNREYAKKLSQLVSRTSKRAIANNICWRAFYQIAMYLGNDSIKLHEEFRERVQVDEKPIPRWKTCAQNVGFNGLGKDLVVPSASLYARKFLSGNDELITNSIVMAVQNGTRQMFENNNWLDGKSRSGAVDKVDGMSKFVGVPKEVLDHTLLNKIFSGLKFTDSYFHNMLALKRFWLAFNNKKILKRVDHDHILDKDDILDPSTSYDPLENRFSIPIAILQGNYFNPNIPMSLNFGGIGSIVGQEIFHGFNTETIKRGAKGKLSNWFQKTSEQEFKNRTKCMIEHYGSYKIGNYSINGARTLDANIASNGGTMAAYLAFRKYERDHGKQKLLVGHNYTPEQMFWLRRGQLSCSAATEEDMEYQINELDISPDEALIWGILTSSYEFAKDFECPVGSKMNPVKKCKLW